MCAHKQKVRTSPQNCASECCKAEMKVSVLSQNTPPVPSSFFFYFFIIFPPSFSCFFSRMVYFFSSVPFLPDRLNACLQLHLGCMRGNWVWDLVGFVSLEITNVWEVTKVA